MGQPEKFCKCLIWKDLKAEESMLDFIQSEKNQQRFESSGLM